MPTYHTMYMLPESLVMTKQKIKIERNSANRKFNIRHEDNEVFLDSEQDEEMALIQGVIDEQCSKDLEAVV